MKKMSLFITILAVCGTFFCGCKKEIFDSLGINFKGIQVLTIGEAKLEEIGTDIFVSNLGSSLDDGISFDFPVSENILDSIELDLVFVDPLLANDMPNGSKRVTSFNNKEGKLLAQHWVEKNNETRLMGFDYSPMGVHRTKIELYQNGEVIIIEDYTNPTFALSIPTFPNNNQRCRYVPWKCCTNGVKVYKLVCEESVVVALEGIGTYENITEIKVKLIPIFPINNPTNIIHSAEIATKQIETIRISDISFN